LITSCLSLLPEKRPTSMRSLVEEIVTYMGRNQAVASMQNLGDLARDLVPDVRDYPFDRSVLPEHSHISTFLRRSPEDPTIRFRSSGALTRTGSLRVLSGNSDVHDRLVENRRATEADRTRNHEGAWTKAAGWSETRWWKSLTWLVGVSLTLGLAAASL